MTDFQIISNNLLKNFDEKVKSSVKKCFQELDSREFTVDNFKNLCLPVQ